MNLLFISPPGAGKGTQSELLTKKYNLYSLSSGAIIRKAMNEINLNSKLLKQNIKNGKLIDDKIMLQLIENELINNISLNNYNGIIFDGFPRNMKQVKLFDKLSLETGLNLDYIINLDIDYELSKERILNRLTCINCGRTYNSKLLKDNKNCESCNHKLVNRLDDNIESLNQRFSTYDKETNKLLTYYNNKGIKIIYIKIDDNLSSNMVFDIIVNKIESNCND